MPTMPDQDPLNQIVAYIQQCAVQGVSYDDMQNRLAQSGWAPAQIHEALTRYHAQAPQAYATTVPPRARNPHRVRNGVMWIVAPFALLVLNPLLAFVLNFGGLHSTSFNIASLMIGIIGTIGIPVGLVVGIVILAKD